MLTKLFTLSTRSSPTEIAASSDGFSYGGDYSFLLRHRATAGQPGLGSIRWCQSFIAEAIDSQSLHETIKRPPF